MIMYITHRAVMSITFLTDGFLKSSLLEREHPEYTVSDSQFTNQIIAEIKFEVS